MKGTLLERNDLMALFEFNKEILEKCSLPTPFYQENYLLIEWLFQLKKSKYLVSAKINLSRFGVR